MKEIAGGCVCCAASGAVPFLVAIQRVLREVKPDRLIIEPSGLAHPSGLHDMFTKNEHLKEHVDLRGWCAHVDARMISTAAKGEGGEKRRRGEKRERQRRVSKPSVHERSFDRIEAGFVQAGEGEEDGKKSGGEGFERGGVVCIPQSNW